MRTHPPEPSFDANGYPTDDTLRAIRVWQPPFGPLMEYVRRAWRYSEYGYWREDPLQHVRLLPEGPIMEYRIATGGWSRNEDLIGALRENLVFWGLCWQEHRRGGYYVFVVKSPAG